MTSPSDGGEAVHREASDIAKVISYEHCHETARDLGYPSLIEALEDLERLRAAREEAERERDDARETLKAWFELAAKAEDAVTATLLYGLKSYLRTSKSGGMSSELADAIYGVLQNYCRLYIGRDLVPILRGMTEQALSSSQAEVERLREALAEVRERVAGVGSYVVADRSTSATCAVIEESKP